MTQAPYLLCVAGLKSSGKTTVCTALIGELTRRGFQVAALKSSHVAELGLDHRATDSYALAGSGARFVLVQGSGQSLIFERGGRSFRQMIRRVPAEVQFIVSEGGESRAAEGVIVCLADASALNETLRVRRVPVEKVIALSGSFTRNRLASPPDTVESFPVVDITDSRARLALAERILRAAGRVP